MSLFMQTVIPKVEKMLLVIRPAVMVEKLATVAVVNGTLLVDSTVGSEMFLVLLLLSPGAAGIVVVGRPNTWVPNTTTRYKLNMFNNFFDFSKI